MQASVQKLNLKKLTGLVAQQTSKQNKLIKQNNDYWALYKANKMAQDLRVQSIIFLLQM